MTRATQGEIVARRRKALGISQNGLAKRLGKTHTTIWALEAGRSVITAEETVRALAEALDLPPDDLYTAGGIVPPDILAAARELDAEGIGRLRAFLAAEAGTGRSSPGGA